MWGAPDRGEKPGLKQGPCGMAASGCGPLVSGGMSSTSVVSATDLTRRFGEGETAVDALRGISLEIETGKLTAVMGPSGSGKSTLMHILAGLDKPTSGTVTIAGQEITTMSDNELTHLRRKHIGFVFQFYNLLPMLTAEENVKLPLSVAGVKVDSGWFAELIDKVGLPGRFEAPSCRALRRAAAASRRRPFPRFEADRRLRR